MFTADMNGQITVWDTKTQEPIVFVYQTTGDSGSEYIFLTPDHYYKATPGINRHINFVKDGQPYAFEQFDLRNNRPDIILSRLGGDPAEVELLHKAWKSVCAAPASARKACQPTTMCRQPTSTGRVFPSSPPRGFCLWMWTSPTRSIISAMSLSPSTVCLCSVPTNAVCQEKPSSLRKHRLGVR